jgi:PAS domain S-box-containing protein
MGPSANDETVARLMAYHDRLEEAGEGRFDDVFREPPAGIGAHEIDTAGIIRRVNPEELRLLGYSEAQMVGRPVSDFIVMQEAAQRAIGQRLEGQRDTKPFHRTFRKGDGTALTMLMVVRLIRGDGGKTTGIRTVMTEAPRPE